MRTRNIVYSWSHGWRQFLVLGPTNDEHAAAPHHNLMNWNWDDVIVIPSDNEADDVIVISSDDEADDVIVIPSDDEADEKPVSVIGRKRVYALIDESDSATTAKLDRIWVDLVRKEIASLLDIIDYAEQMIETDTNVVEGLMKLVLQNMKDTTIWMEWLEPYFTQ
ncbi:hypothetical protein Tco_0054012 [Tanacetum coccineum]